MCVIGRVVEKHEHVDMARHSSKYFCGNNIRIKTCVVPARILVLILEHSLKYVEL